MNWTNRWPETNGFYGYRHPAEPVTLATVVRVTLTDEPVSTTEPPPPFAFVGFIQQADAVAIETLDGEWTEQIVLD